MTDEKPVVPGFLNRLYPLSAMGMSLRTFGFCFGFLATAEAILEIFTYCVPYSLQVFLCWNEGLESADLLTKDELKLEEGEDISSKSKSPSGSDKRGRFLGCRGAGLSCRHLWMKLSSRSSPPRPKVSIFSFSLRFSCSTFSKSSSRFFFWSFSNLFSLTICCKALLRCSDSFRVLSQVSWSLRHWRFFPASSFLNNTHQTAMERESPWYWDSKSSISASFSEEKSQVIIFWSII